MGSGLVWVGGFSEMGGGVVGIWAVDEFWWVTHRMYAFEQVVSVSFLHVPLLSSSDIRFLRLYVWGGGTRIALVDGNQQ